jgi:hypothetical protein
MAKVFDKEPVIFTKEQVKNQWFYRWLFDFFNLFENHD